MDLRDEDFQGYPSSHNSGSLRDLDSPSSTHLPTCAHLRSYCRAESIGVVYGSLPGHSSGCWVMCEPKDHLIFLVYGF